MRFQFGITSKLTIIFLAFVSVLLLGFGLPSSMEGNRALVEAAEAELYSTAAEKEMAIENWLTDRETRIASLSKSRNLTRKVEALSNAPPGSHLSSVLHDELIRELWDWTVTSPDYRALMILHPRTGLVLASTDATQEGVDKAKTTSFVHGLIGPYVQSLGYRISPSDALLAISTPLHRSDGLLVGVLVAEVNLDPLTNIVRSKSGMHRTDDAYLVNQAHNFVTRPRGMEPEAAGKTKIYTPAVNRCLNGESGVFTTENYLKIPTITAYHWLENRQACLILDLDAAEATASAQDYRRMVLLIAGLALIAAVLMAYIIAHGITRPVVALQQGVARFTRGELDVRLPGRSSDEIGVLEREFNRMAQAIAEKETRLAEYAEELEQMVQERTDALRASEVEMQALVAAMTDVILVIDEQGTYCKVPNAPNKQLLRPREEMIGKRLHDVIPSDQADNNLAAIQQALRSGTPVSTEYSLYIDGTTRWFNATASPISQTEVVWVAREITGLKQTEAALRESQRALATLLSNLPGMVYRCRNDEQWTMEFVSDGCLQLTGYAPEDLLQNGQIAYGQLIHPDDRQPVLEMIQYALQKQQSFQLTYRICPARGGEKWVWEQGRGVFSPSGELEALEGFIHDITEREQARQELQKNERKFRSIIEQSSDGIVLVDPCGAIVEWNRAEELITGIRKETAVGRPIWEVQFGLVPPENRTPEMLQRLQKTVDHVTRQGNRHLNEKLWEMDIVREDGERRSIQSAVFSIEIERGYMLGSISRDLTEQKHAERTLQASEERYRKLVEHAPDVIFTLTPSGLIASLNPAFTAATGCPIDPWIGKPFYNLLHPESLSRVHSVISQVIKGETPRPFELRIGCGGERYVTAEFTATPLLEDGKVTGILGLARDIGERKRREREQEALVRLSGKLRTAASRAKMIPLILDEVLDLFQAEAATISVLDPETNEIVIELGRGLSARATGARTPASKSLSAAVIATAKPCVVEEKDFSKIQAGPDLAPPMAFLAGIPLIAEEQVQGVLWMGRNLPVGPDDVQLLSAVAEIAANSIHRAELHEQMERSLQRLSALNMIDRAINSSLDLRVTLNVFLSQVTAQLSVDAADILLLDPHTNLLEYTAGKGFRGKGIEASQLRLGEGLAGQAALNRQPVSIPDLRQAGGTFIRAFLINGEGFASYFCVPLLAKGHLKGVLEVFHRAPLNPDAEWMNFLESLAGQATIAIDNAQLFDEMQRSNVDLALAYDATIEGWSRALDLRDKETEGHTRRVVELTLHLAGMLGITKEEDLVHIRRGALLHDIGKMGIPDAILLKPGPLTGEEWAQMRKHPGYAHELLAPVGYLRPALDIPYAHHEKWDGTGYPRGLKGKEIPLAARIFAVVDVWDALISDRPYRKAWSKSDALKYIREQSGVHFDPQVVQSFLTLISR